MKLDQPEDVRLFPERIEASQIPEITPNDFVSTWDTRIGSSSEEDTKQIQLPLSSIGEYQFEVSWGDGSLDSITQYDQTEVLHTYSFEGEYTIIISGVFKGWKFAENGGNQRKLVEISQWGALHLGNEGKYFAGCENLHLTATDALNLTGTTSLHAMFQDCIFLGDLGNLNTWDVSKITSMCAMFSGATNFNQAIGSWNVTNVSDMSLMFYGAASFNQPIGMWNVSKVERMQSMFYEATNFNQDLSLWDVSQVKYMNSMFASASHFNQEIAKWNISRVEDMNLMFCEASQFNQDLSSWDVSGLREMLSLFRNAHNFNQDLGSWNVSRVENMANMLLGANMSCLHYDSILLQWSQLELQPNVEFHAGDAFINSIQAANAKQAIIDTYSWHIQDGGIWDADGDGLLNENEVVVYLTSPYLADTDMDGVLDGQEIQYQSNPHCNDTDADGLSDFAELTIYQTSLILADSDSDGISDYDELLVYYSNPNLIDSDSDGLSDYQEIFEIGTDPSNEDTDKDGYRDGVDPSPFSFFIPTGLIILISTICVVVIITGWFTFKRKTFEKRLSENNFASITSLLEKNQIQEAFAQTQQTLAKIRKHHITRLLPQFTDMHQYIKQLQMKHIQAVLENYSGKITQISLLELGEKVKSIITKDLESLLQELKEKNQLKISYDSKTKIISLPTDQKILKKDSDMMNYLSQLDDDFEEWDEKVVQKENKL